MLLFHSQAIWKKETLKMLQLDFEITDEDIRTLEKLDGLNIDNQRSEILKSLETIDVQACPGSGKTTLIAAKLKLLAKKWSDKTAVFVYFPIRMWQKMKLLVK